ncbi:Wadjet anti-phage system protein JetD domain-containing protein [Thioclava sp. JE_KL1]|uniref:Wadjet anti-phage system protein JetD domain-containing protein n=1 Tax=Thioclava sp. JE_KL1 TaxID=2651187 RepID=UPI00128D7CEB|nr:Wadjet anti-phage system protein JetD domain-containing protein [Thioclava sp. JE_KL1]MPQ96185.1 hypothetical protein [Thioclava sp. JE_KL1]
MMKVHELQYPDDLRADLKRSRKAMGYLWGHDIQQEPDGPLLEKSIKTRGMTRESPPEAVSEIYDWRDAWKVAAKACGANLVETRKNFALARDLAFVRKISFADRTQLARFLGDDHLDRMITFDAHIASLKALKGASICNDTLRALLYRQAPEDLDTVLALARWRQNVSDEDLADMSLRELPVRGMDTKWIERHRQLVLSVFREFGWIDEAAESFEGKLGLFEVSKSMVKIRIHPSSCEGGWVSNMGIQPQLFAEAPPRVSRVLIVENETTLDRFEPGPGDCIIFGQGKAILAYAKLMPWLSQVAILYWGDCDGHGFDILDRLREQLPHVLSFMMDWESAQDHLQIATAENPNARVARPMPNLTEGEARLRSCLSERGAFLEQERLPRATLRQMLERAPAE